PLTLQDKSGCRKRKGRHPPGEGALSFYLCQSGNVSRRLSASTPRIARLLALFALLRLDLLLLRGPLTFRGLRLRFFVGIRLVGCGGRFRSEERRVGNGCRAR